MIAWVLGATGKIGSAVCGQLSSQGIKLVGIGRNENKHFHYGQWVTWNSAETSRCQVSLVPPDVVFFLSGQTSARQARSDVVGDVKANLVALINVTEAAISLGNRPHIVAAGSITESRLDINGLSPSDSMNAIAGFYETGKAVQRLYLAQYARESLIDFTVLRLSNVYGGAVTHNRDRGFLDQSIRTAIDEQKIRFYKGADFIRDYIYIDDVARAFVAAALMRNATRNRTFDIGSERSVAIGEVMLTLKKLVEARTSKEVDLEAITPPANLHLVERKDRYVDSTEFRKAADWQCETDLITGLNAAISMWESRSPLL